jgi:hypothetical protein
MAQLRLVEPVIDTYGSRRAWKRQRRERRRGPSPTAVAVASLAVLVIVFMILLLGQVASAFVS